MKTPANFKKGPLDKTHYLKVAGITVNSHNKYKNTASTAPESTLKICLTRARNNDRIETKACLGKTIM